jgi:hypothetical protein
MDFCNVRPPAGTAALLQMARPDARDRSRLQQGRRRRAGPVAGVKFHIVQGFTAKTSNAVQWNHRAAAALI